jgi:MFS family permease
VASGALAERFDPRRVIQVGMGLFMLASLAWGYFFITDSLQMWQAMVILVIHGCAGVLWQTPNQMLIYDIVGPQDLASAVRLNAMARYLGILVGPAVGGVILLALGPAHGIMLNTIFYLPLVLWLVKAPYGPRFRKGTPPPRRAVRGLADIVSTMRDVRQHTVIVSMTVLAGAASFFVGNAYSSQMPGFAAELGHGDPGVSYSMLLAADAAGGLLAGLALEGRNIMPPRPHRHHPRAAVVCCADGFRAVAQLRAGAVLPAGRRLPRTVVQRDGAEPGADQCPTRHARPRHRPVQHGKPRLARLQRHLGRPARQPDRHSLVAGTIGAGGDARGGRTAGDAVR